MSVWLPQSTLSDEPGLLPNARFEDGLDGWVFRPGDPSQVSLVDDGSGRGKVLELHPNGKLLGVETDRLKIGGLLAPNQAYRVESQLKHEGLQKGVFAFSM